MWDISSCFCMKMLPYLPICMLFHSQIRPQTCINDSNIQNVTTGPSAFNACSHTCNKKMWPSHHIKGDKWSLLMHYPGSQVFSATVKFPLYLWVDYIVFSNRKLVQVRKETESCSVLLTVYQASMDRPKASMHIHVICQQYSDMSHIVSTDNGLLLKGLFIIPASLQNLFSLACMKSIKV